MSHEIPGTSRSCQTLVDLVRTRAEERPDERLYTFLVDGEQEEVHWTYRELDQRARAVAAALQERGAVDRPVLLLYPPGLEYIGAFFGCLYAGVLAVPAYPPWNERQVARIQTVADDSGARIALASRSVKRWLGLLRVRGRMVRALGRLPFIEHLGERLSGALDVPNLTQGRPLDYILTDELPEGAAEAWKEPKLRGATPAFLQYTSGSTSAPRGVVLDHDNLLHNLMAVYRCFEARSDSQAVIWLPPYHDMGLIGGILEPLYGGFHDTLLSPMAFLQRPLRWLEAVTRHRGTISGGPNFAYELCTRKVSPEDVENLDLASWEVAFCGAEPVRADTVRRFIEVFEPAGFRAEAFYPCYGLAEGTLISSGIVKTEPPEAVSFEPRALEKHRAVEAAEGEEGRRLVSCGTAIPDQRLLIVDPEQRTPLPDGEVGEIWIAGPSVARGYWRRPEATRRTFEARLADGDGPYLRTGDFGFLRDGELFVAGRMKDLLIIRGANHHPQDIEYTVERCHAALRPGCCACFAVEVDGEEQLVVAQELRRQAVRRPPVEEIVEAVREAVAENHGISLHALALLKTGRLPKTTSGKVRRQATREGFLEGNLVTVAVWRAEEEEEEAEAPAEPAGEAPPAEFGPPPAQAALERFLAERVAEHARLDVSEVSPEVPFATYGLGSKEAVALSGELEEHLGRRLSPVLAYEHPTIRSLATHLSDSAEVSVPGGEAVPLEGEAGEPVALVGLACRFPGSPDPEAFWELLEEGRDGIGEVPPERWSPELDDGAARFGGFLPSVDRFDAELFGIAPREAASMDPQQRLLLEVTWEALERSGQSRRRLAGSRCGVFVGISTSDYSHLLGQRQAGVDAYTGTGSALSIAANRLSYLFDLRGPSVAVDTACSSSLVAVHMAARSLRAGECDAALAGGVNLMLVPEPTLAFSRANMMAPGGRCRTFDAGAEGYVRGEGCGVVVLKRLSDARRDGDRILAVIRGSAINQDGRSNGLTAPNGSAQRAVLRDALEDACLKPTEVGYIETHGTGTPLGDPIEVEALKAVYGEGETPLVLGAAKSHIGHLEAAAGVAGLIKATLVLAHGRIPPNLHLEELNPRIELDGSRLEITTEPVDWAPGQTPRRAGVSSFGFGGTNCHLLLEEAPQVALPESQWPPRSTDVLTLSAATEASLEHLIERYRAFLPVADSALADICASAAGGRAELPERLAVVASSVSEAVAELDAHLDGEETGRSFRGQAPAGGTGPVAFLYTGQGAQHAGMGRDLYEAEPVFRSTIDRCAEILGGELDVPLTDLLFEPAGDRLDQTVHTQPALLSLELALTALLRSWGLEPTVVAGHSVGQYAAAVTAGVFDLEDALRLLADRARRMQALPPGGGMAAVFAPEEAVREAVEPHADELSVAAVNGPSHVVVSGRRETLEEVVAPFKAQGSRVVSLTVSHAFHSPLMEPVLEPFRQRLESVSLEPPGLELICDLSGQPAGEELATPEHWVRHVHQTIRFGDVVETLWERGCRTFVEIGPQPVLLGMARRAVPEGEPALWVPTLRRNRDDVPQLLDAAARLWTAGAPVDWEAFRAGRPSRKVLLPTYPFEPVRHWIDAEPAAEEELPAGVVHALRPSRREHPFLDDHRVFGTAVLPATAYVDAVLAGARQVLGDGPVEISGLSLQRGMVLPEERGAVLHVHLEPDGESHALRITDGSGEHLHVSARVRRPAETSAQGGELPAPPGEELSVEELYEHLASRGLEYGPAFRGIERVWCGEGEARGEVRLPATAGALDGWSFHPALLDACFQLVGAAVFADRDELGTYIPLGIERLVLLGRPEETVSGHVRLRDDGEIGGETLIGDLEISTATGRPVLRVEGLSLRQVGEEQIEMMRLAARREAAAGPPVAAATGPTHPLLGHELPRLAERPETRYWEVVLEADELPFAGVYRRGSRRVLSSAAIAELALAAAELDEAPSTVTSLEVHAPLVVEADEPTRLQLALSAGEPSERRFKVFRATPDGERGVSWRLHATVLLAAAGASAA